MKVILGVMMIMTMTTIIITLCSVGFHVANNDPYFRFYRNISVRLQCCRVNAFNMAGVG